MYIYSVEIDVPKGQENPWLIWMEQKHIPDVMATKCFSGYRLLKIIEDADDTSIKYRAEYSLGNPDDYNRYLSLFAKEMREDFNNRFKGDFTFRRNLLQVI